MNDVFCLKISLDGLIVRTLLEFSASSKGLISKNFQFLKITYKRIVF